MDKSKTDGKRPRKRRREDTKHHQVSQAKLKKRIRDVQRLLNLESLKANVRRDHEQELASLKHQLDNAVKTNQEQKMAKRYQMVRFVERQKATRRLRQAEKLQQENPSAENKDTVEKYDLDLYYTTHFPLTEKYIALYPKSEIESDEVLGKRERIRRELREEMVHGKKKISGSNKVELGKRKRTKRDEEEAASGADTAGDSDEDVLDFTRHKIGK